MGFEVGGVVGGFGSEFGDVDLLEAVGVGGFEVVLGGPAAGGGVEADPEGLHSEGAGGADVVVDSVADHEGFGGVDFGLFECPVEDAGVGFVDLEVFADGADFEEVEDAALFEDVEDVVGLVGDDSEAVVGGELACGVGHARDFGGLGGPLGEEVGADAFAEVFEVGVGVEGLDERPEIAAGAEVGFALGKEFWERWAGGGVQGFIEGAVAEGGGGIVGDEDVADVEE